MIKKLNICSLMSFILFILSIHVNNFFRKHSSWEIFSCELPKAYTEHEKMGKKAILFVMTDDTRNCDDVAEYLRAAYLEFADKDAVLVIHTKNNGDIRLFSGIQRGKIIQIRIIFIIKGCLNEMMGGVFQR